MEDQSKEIGKPQHSLKRNITETQLTCQLLIFCLNQVYNSINKISVNKEWLLQFILKGETSAGKTTLINHFLGQKIFSTNNVAATATVCRIRHSKTLMLKAYTKDERILADIHFDNFTEMRSTIKKFTDLSYMEKDIKDTVFYVDIYLPVKVLKVFL